MMIRITLAATLSLLAACGGPSGDQGPDPALTGRTFVSTEVTGRTLAAGTRLELAFPEAGRLTVHAGCNRISGDVSFDSDRLNASDLDSTLMGCDQARSEQDDWLRTFFKSSPRFALNGDHLVLTGGSEVIKFVEQKADRQDRPLQGTRWAVESLLAGQTASSVPQDAQAFLQFGPDTVTGSTGCNSLNGTAIQEPDTITFSGIRTTRKACAQGLAALEAAMLATLDGKVGYRIDGDVLELHHPAGNGLRLHSTAQPSPAVS